MQRSKQSIFRKLLSFVLVILVIIAAIAAIGRGLFPADLATRAEPVRQQILKAFEKTDPFALQREKEVREFDSRYAANLLMTSLHVFAGGIFVVFALLQFSSRIRNRHLDFHRWSGRMLVVLAFICTIAGLYFGLLMPYGGFIEAAAIVIAAILFLGALLRAVVAIRNREITLHREWMIRAFAVGVGISTVRVFMALFDFFLTPIGVAPKVVFVLGIWTGWSFTIAAAELWIRFTRFNAPRIEARRTQDEIISC